MNSMAKLEFPGIQAILAMILAGGFVVLIFYMAMSGQIESDVFKVLAGAFSTVGFTSVVGYYFGSSQGSSAKDATINTIATKAMVDGPSVPPAPTPAPDRNPYVGNP